MEPITFGRWIKKLRAEQDLTQEMLAELVGCATPTLRAFEIGTRRPSREMAERIADTLQVPGDQRGEFLRLARLPVERATDEPADPGPISSVTVEPPARASLPQALNSLIGREAERNALQALLLDEPGAQRARLVTLVGAGGMGKTRLALDLATRVAPAFADGVAFVALAALQSAQNLPFTLAEALGISLQGSMDSRQQVLSYLHTRTLLLVLDNFEHLLVEPASIGWVKEILQSAPGVQLLVTSRERLRIGGERIFELGGLALSAATHSADQADALLLFLDRAQQADSGFVLDATNRPAAVRICQLLGGMPLGIELAAAWVRILSCAEIATEIARNIDFLELADRDASPRHRSVRAVFDHSWQLLNEAEQQLLMGLAYFRGGCTRQAAEQVVGATLPLLASLIDKSLITRGAGGRFVLHELIRQFAADHLQRDSVRLAQISQHHAEYFALFLQRNQARLEGVQQHTAMSEIAAETENLLLAWEWICANHRWAWVEPFVLVFGYHLDIRGQHQLNASLLDQGLQAFRLTPQAQVGAENEQQLAMLALLYSGRGFALARLYQPGEAQRDLEQGLALARQSEASVALVYTTLWSGFILSTMGQFAQSIPLLQEALHYSIERQRPWEEAVAHTLLGLAYNVSGDVQRGYPEALKAYQQMRVVGDPHAMAICISQLSSLIEATGQGGELFDAINESLRQSSEQGDQWARAMWLTNMGIVAHRRGDLAAAQVQLQASIQLLEEVNELWGSTFTAVRLASVLIGQDRQAEAERLLQSVIAKANTAQMAHTKVNAQLQLAELWLAQNKIADVTTLCERLVAVLNLSSAQRQQLDTLRQLIENNRG